MRIISSFHDYYDCIQGTGQDQTLLYLREKEEVRGWYGPIVRRGLSGRSTGYTFAEYIIGFCGRIYPLVTALDTKEQQKALREDPKADCRVFCYNLEDIEKFVENHCDKKEKEKFYAKSYSGYGIGIRHRDLKECLLAAEQSKDSYRPYFEKKRSPIFACRASGYQRYTEWNASLKEYHFQKVFDPFTAFQEISMFLGGLAMPEKTIPDVSDKVMAEIKGFNKWSFRKEPSKK